MDAIARCPKEEKLNVKEVETFLPHDNYYNSCRFKQYVNHQIKHTCILFGGRIERDGNNFIRLEACKNAEVKGIDK